MVSCPKCGVDVSNLGKHLRRKRCEMQHIRKAERERMKLAKAQLTKGEK
jgi:hypothetical protein